MKTAHDIGRADEIPCGTHRVVAVGGRQFGVFNVAGSYYALPNACFHQNGPLCRGRVDGTWIAGEGDGFERTWALDGEIVICPWHSLEFHIPTGRCLAYPSRKLPVYEVRVEAGRLQIVL